MEPIDISNILNQENFPLDNTCSICLEQLYENTYTVPECNHTFHTNCIVRWFRNSNPSCPYFRSVGPEEQNRYYNRYTREGRYKLIRNFARRKNAPEHLKKLVGKLVSFNKSIRQKSKIYSNWKKSKEGILYKELHKKSIKMNNRSNKWQIKRKINELKSIISNYPVIPLPIIA